LTPAQCSTTAQTALVAAATSRFRNPSSSTTNISPPGPTIGRSGRVNPILSPTESECFSFAISRKELQDVVNSSCSKDTGNTYKCKKLRSVCTEKQLCRIRAICSKLQRRPSTITPYTGTSITICLFQYPRRQEWARCGFCVPLYCHDTTLLHHSNLESWHDATLRNFEPNCRKPPKIYRKTRSYSLPRKTCTHNTASLSCCHRRRGDVTELWSHSHPAACSSPSRSPSSETSRLIVIRPPANCAQFGSNPRSPAYLKHYPPLSI
jgi:hypothetical protein